MWFNRKKKEQTSSTIPSEMSRQIFWQGMSADRPDDTKDQLAKSVIEYAFQIPLSKWEDEGQEGIGAYDRRFRTTTEKGAVIILGSNYYTNSYRDSSTSLFIRVDDDEIAGYADGDPQSGYRALYSLHEHVEKEISRRRDEANKPSREAYEAEQKRKQAEQEAIEAKKANDILRRL